ncbi:methyltransferase domain-containing protein [Burkholderia cepacia]|nr:methyltransferase domain-containing protein [Burkholderia cepacia]
MHARVGNRCTRCADPRRGRGRHGAGNLRGGLARAGLAVHGRRPVRPMLALARSNVEAAGCGARTAFVEDGVDALPDTPAFDGATLIGVLHHVPGDEAKAALLQTIARRLKPGAPLVLAGNHRRYADHPRLLDAWQQRWRMKGATPDAVRAQLAKILQGADPPVSEEAVFALLRDAGFDAPLRFFASLFWGAWIAVRRA